MYRPTVWSPPVSPPQRRPTPAVPVPTPTQPPPERPAFEPYVGPPRGAHRSRLRFLAWLWIVCLAAIVVRLVDFQVVRSEWLARRAAGQQERHIVIEAHRGRIVDRNGRDLAVSLAAASVAINPRKVRDSRQLARRISDITGEPAARVHRRISDRSKAFAWIARNIEEHEAQRLYELAPGTMNLMSGTRRAHPFGTLAGQTIGHVNIDNEGGDGLELLYDHGLSGAKGWTTALVDGFGEPVPNTAQTYVRPQDGQSLRLTLDADYQAIVEHELSMGVEATRAASGLALLYEAETGAVRAIANVPTYNPDAYASATDAFRRRNRAITDPYEPGSTFKMIPASAALAQGVVAVGEKIDCGNGHIVVAGQTIRDSHPNGILPFREVFAQSSNVGTIAVARRLGATTFYEYLRLFGFGAETGVDLPGESKGLLARPSRWSRRSQATISIGQEIGVTAMQIAAAYGAIANGGWLMQPHLVEAIIGRDGTQVEAVEPVRVRQVVPADVADQVVDLLCGVVEEGTGTTARIGNLRVGGKTGTAQIARSDNRGYEPGAYVASFIGFLPEMQPRLVCVVSIAKPRTSYYGSSVAGPVFKRIMSRILNRDITVIQRSQIATGPAMLDVTGMTRGDAVSRLSALNVNVRTVGAGDVVIGQWPPSSALIPVGSSVELVLADYDELAPKVPDVRGMPIRQAVAVLGAAGLRVRLNGAGVVQSQDPRAGSRPPRDGAVVVRGGTSDWSRIARRGR